jgi:hypothetical protein
MSYDRSISTKSTIVPSPKPMSTTYCHLRDRHCSRTSERRAERAASVWRARSGRLRSGGLPGRDRPGSANRLVDGGHCRHDRAEAPGAEYSFAKASTRCGHLDVLSNRRSRWSTAGSRNDVLCLLRVMKKPPCQWPETLARFNPRESWDGARAPLHVGGRQRRGRASRSWGTSWRRHRVIQTPVVMWPSGCITRTVANRQKERVAFVRLFTSGWSRYCDSFDSAWDRYFDTNHAARYAGASSSPSGR